MNKLFLPAIATLLLVGSCQSDEALTEDNQQENTTSSHSAAVPFVFSTTSVNRAPAARTTYTPDGSVHWEHGDYVSVLSPSKHSNTSHQVARYYYTVNEDTGGSNVANFYLDEGDDILWNTSEESQSFYAYHPAVMMKRDDLESLNASGNFYAGIVDVDTITGAASFYLPPDDGNMEEIWQVGDGFSGGVAPWYNYAIAATQGVSTQERSNVELQFNDFMNVLRIHIHNPRSETVSINMLEIISSDAPVSGLVRVSPTSAYDVRAGGNVAKHNHFTYDIITDPGSDILTPSKKRRSRAPGWIDGQSDVYAYIQLLPQTYTAGTLQIKMIVNEPDIYMSGETDDITKTINIDFPLGSLLKVRINLPENEDYGIEMVDIPGGTFELGGATDSYVAVDAHPTLTVSNFSIGKTEVTATQWEAVVSDAISELQNSSGEAYEALTAAGFAMIGNNLQLNNINTGITTTDPWPGAGVSDWPLNSGTADYLSAYPAYNVSYDDITNVFIPILNALTGKNYSLPTEAQWEYAARGRNYIYDFAYATGGDGVKNETDVDTDVDETALKTVAWYANNAYEEGMFMFNAPAAVTTKDLSIEIPVDDPIIGGSEDGPVYVNLLRANGFGLADMSGNVAEWCRDSYAPYPETVSDNYVNNTVSDIKVYRGGSATDNAANCAVSYRAATISTTRNANIGFRLVKSNSQQ